MSWWASQPINLPVVSALECNRRSTQSVRSLSLYLSGCGNSTTCACLLSTTWPPGTDGHNNLSPWWRRYSNKRETEMERRSGEWKEATHWAPLTACHSNTKVTPGGGDRAKGRSGQRGEGASERKKRRLLPLFAALSACLLPSSVILPCRPPPY